MVKEITVTELKSWIDTNKDFQLIDVRDVHELDIATIGGENIPLNTIPQNLSKISDNKQVIVYCRSGKRSANAIKYIQNQTGQQNLFNLKGGILAWSDEIDNSIKKY
ncbi:MAG: rhodanese-like domain-containing protein [Cyclobacteriaceae bacterium]|nr:rhodanese-like domain-containing protein [Cyclobacteriaceae bacterium]